VKYYFASWSFCGLTLIGVAYLSRDGFKNSVYLLKNESLKASLAKGRWVRTWFSSGAGGVLLSGFAAAKKSPRVLVLAAAKPLRKNPSASLRSAPSLSRDGFQNFGYL